MVTSFPGLNKVATTNLNNVSFRYGSIEYFEESLRLKDLFGEVSGLRLNYVKTDALWIGENIYSDLKWAKGKIKALGVWFRRVQIYQFLIIKYTKLKK